MNQKRYVQWIMVDEGESVLSGENDSSWALERNQSQLGQIKVEGNRIVQSLEV